MSTREEVARQDAYERLAYAAVADDTAGVTAVLESLTTESSAEQETSDEVKAIIVDTDPVTAAAVGWLAFPDLAERVAKNPKRYLDEAEEQAFARHGSYVLRLVVACRLEGVPFNEGLAQIGQDPQNRYDLAARGNVMDVDAIADLLREHGLVSDDEQHQNDKPDQENDA